MLKLWIFPRSLGGICRERALCFIVLTGLALLAALVPHEALAQTVDPQSLVGEWAGTWSYISHGNTPGQYTMTVTKVDGNQVYGRIERGPGAYQPRTISFDFAGTLEGSKLVFAGALNSGEVTIYGTEMRGTALENMRMNISMTKNK